MFQWAYVEGLLRWKYDSFVTIGLGVAQFADICSLLSFVTEHNKGFYPTFCAPYCINHPCWPLSLDASGYDCLNNRTVLMIVGRVQFFFSYLSADSVAYRTDLTYSNAKEIGQVFNLVRSTLAYILLITSDT
jgi:hypothetical protein